jgi:hypothetical protein
MRGAVSACELAARLGLHPSGREWRGNCPSCGDPNTFTLTERRGRVLGWCVSCQDRDFMTRLPCGEDRAVAPTTQATRAIVDIADEHRQAVEQYFERFKYIDGIVGDAACDVKFDELGLPENIRRAVEDLEATSRRVRYGLEDLLVVLSK